jgi:predicted HicB family RNase H-like nuclease
LTAPAEAPKRGRKPLPQGTTKDARVELRVHPDTKAAWQAKADAAGLSLAAWIEAKLNAAK